jgi:hypothetical protein
MRHSEVIIFSNQRSGSHLLLNALKQHPKIKGRRELYYSLREGRDEEQLHGYVDGKVNIAILHYNQLDNFYKAGGSLENVKIMLLLRNPRNVAISTLQLMADRKLNKNILGHGKVDKEYGKRGVIDESKIPHRISVTIERQNAQKEMLRDINHFVINYEDFVPNEKNIEYLDDKVAKKILNFIGLEFKKRLYTNLRKTRIYGVTIAGTLK